jgi:hypothetical protein
MGMEQAATVTIAAPPPIVFGSVDDLARYPEWTDLVSRAVAVDEDEDGRPAWAVDLRAQVGPLARSKRLRMVQTELTPTASVVFERAEADGRRHASWRLTATLEPDGNATRLTMVFAYGGGFWGPVVERLLGDEIEQSKLRLKQLVESG